MRCHQQTWQLGFIVALFLTSLSTLGHSQQPPSTDEAAEVPATGAINGKVVNESGQPLPNATVTVRAFGSVGQNRSETTDKEGRFRVTGLDRLAYLVSAGLPAYTALPREPGSTQSSYYRVGESVTLTLVKGGVITGTVTTSTGEPVVGLSVRAQMLRDANGQPLRYGATMRDRLTDDRGIYRLYGLPTGTYLVFAGGSINFAGFAFNPYETDAPTYSPSSTRDTAAEINVRAGEETTNVDIRYRGDPGHLVSGIASGPQSEEVGINVILTSASDGGSQWSASSYQPAVGRGFVFSGVADGDYDVTAQSFYPGGEWTVSEPRRIKVRGADITGIELTTKPLGSITGRLVLEASKAIECKGKRRPLFTETLVWPWHNEKGVDKNLPQFPWSLGGPTYPNKEGDITLRNLAAGQYYFIAQFAAKYWYLQSISLQQAATAGARSTPASKRIDAARNWTTIKSADRLSGLTITLAEGAASLHGQLAVAEGAKAPPRLFVYLVPAEREKAEDVLRFYATPVSPDGKIVLNNLAPGRYWIVAQPAIDNAPAPLTKLRLPDEVESRAKLHREAEAGKIGIEFKPCQNVMNYQLSLKVPGENPG